MTLFDYVFLAVVCISAVVGLWRGLVSEVMALVAWVAALFIAWRFSANASVLFVNSVADPGLRQVVAGVVLFLAVLIVAAVLRYLLRELLKAVGLGSVDRLFGAAFGVARGLLIALVVVFLGGVIGVSREPWWSQSYFAPPLETAVMAARPWLPAAVAEHVRFR